MTKPTDKTILYVGTFTRPAPYIDGSNGEGIYVYAFDPDTGALAYQSETHGIDSPSYLTVDPRGEFLYANSEIFGWDEGLVKAYAIDQQTGALTYLNMQPSRGSLTSYVSVEQMNQYVLVTNYWTGSVVLLRIQADGSLSQVIDKQQHSGTGPNPERQEGPHTHCVIMDPTSIFSICGGRVRRTDQEHSELSQRVWSVRRTLPKLLRRYPDQYIRDCHRSGLGQDISLPA